MPLSEAERQELAELKRMDELEAKYGPAESVPETPAAAPTPQGGLMSRIADRLTPSADSVGGKVASMVGSDKGFWQSGADNVKAFMNAPEATEAQLAEGQKHAQDGLGAASLALPAGSLVASAGKYGDLAAKGVRAAVQAPKALTKLATFLSASAPRRVVTNAAVGGVQGALAAPQGDETRGGNALRGAGLAGLLGAGGELAAKGVGLAASGVKALGEGMTGLKETSAQAYIDNPQLAEDMGTQYRENRGGLSNDTRDQVKDSLRKLATATRPERDKLALLGIGTKAQVQPGDYTGTAAGGEMQRAWDQQGNQVEIPHSKGYMEAANKTAPAPLPSGHSGDMSLEWQQLLDAKRASQKAANYKYAQNPIAYTAADDAEAAAASRLNRAAEGVSKKRLPNGDPDPTDTRYRDLNDTLSEAARHKDVAKHALANNPLRVLGDSEAIGSSPMRELQQYLDTNTGSQFETQARALEAGREIQSPLHGLLKPLLRRLGKPVLRSTPLPLPTAGNLQSLTRGAEAGAVQAPQTLMQILYGDQK